MPRFITHYRSPIGTLRISASNAAITGIEFCDTAGKEQDAHPLLHKMTQQLDEYFRGERETFDLPIQPTGTAFQLNVWKMMSKIPYGKTMSYKQLATNIGSPKASRAVGSACGKNPIVVLIPCHRVLAANGGLGGYSSGLDRKRTLLAVEQ